MNCSKCGMPDSRPGSIFTDGVCQACLNYDARELINWEDRRKQFERVCNEYRSTRGYDCIVAVSGGKDSHFILKKVLEQGMHPLLVTVTDSFTHTKAGLHNLRNLITWSKCNHFTYTINHDLFVRATRWAFEQTGEALKFVEYAIYTIPYLVAQKFGIGLVFFGENSAYEYGSTTINQPFANVAIRRMSEALNDDREFWNRGGITDEELKSIDLDRKLPGPDVHYMSYYFPWSSVTHLKAAEELGFHSLEGEWEREGTIENFEQIDSMAYMVHLWLKYPKFGFQRVADIASRRVREGILDKDEADELVKERDAKLDPLALKDFCDTCGYTEDEFWHIVKTAAWNHYVKG